jgi:hypothetical protein
LTKYHCQPYQVAGYRKTPLQIATELVALYRTFYDLTGDCATTLSWACVIFKEVNRIMKIYGERNEMADHYVAFHVGSPPFVVDFRQKETPERITTGFKCCSDLDSGYLSC